MSLAVARTHLKDQLAGISGMTAYAHPPNSVEKLPCAIVDWDPRAAEYEHPGNLTKWHFIVLLLLSHWDATAAYGEIDDYIDKTGTKSIKANIEADWLSSDYAVVRGCRNVGAIQYRRAEVMYGAEFEIEVGDTT